MKSFSRSSLALLSGFVAASVFGLAGEVKAGTTGNTPVQVNVNGVLEFVDGTLGTLVDLGETKDLNLGNFLNLSDIGVRSNQKNGFKITVVSENGGALKHQDSTVTDTIDYNLQSTAVAAVGDGSTVPSASIAAASAALEGSATLFSSNTFDAGANCAAAEGCTVNVSIQLDATQAGAVQTGIYEDTIYFGLFTQN